MLRRISVAALLAACLAFAEPAKKEFGDDMHFYPSTEAPQKALDALVGKPLPPIQGAEWINGEVTPESMKGKVVLVDVWATWCGPCLRAVPENNELAEKHKNDLVLVGVCSANGQEKLAETVTKHKIAYPVCKDPDNKTAKSYNVAFYPTYIAVDRNGIVRAAGLKPAAAKQVVEKLIAEKAGT